MYLIGLVKTSRSLVGVFNKELTPLLASLYDIKISLPHKDYPVELFINNKLITDGMYNVIAIVMPRLPFKGYSMIDSNRLST
jgi:hypothetical protein